MATLYGIGVGPGDPELITLKAHRLIQHADVIAYIVNRDGYSLAKHIATESMANNSHAILMPITIEMNRDRLQANASYEVAALAISNELNKGRDVVFLCEGDPMFYGSFCYLLAKLPARFNATAVPGVSSIHSATAAVLTPLSLLTDNVAIVNGRCDEEVILNALRCFDSVLILKAGVSRKKLLGLFALAERTDDVIYLENISRDDENIIYDIRHLEDKDGPYFSLFFVTKHKQFRQKGINPLIENGKQRSND
ncbi:MAG: precorrin-2 C(20)-methyltransferase [Spongiibacteraceae bacterium]